MYPVRLGGHWFISSVTSRREGNVTQRRNPSTSLRDWRRDAEGNLILGHGALSHSHLPLCVSTWISSPSVSPIYLSALISSHPGSLQSVSAPLRLCVQFPSPAHFLWKNRIRHIRNHDKKILTYSFRLCIFRSVLNNDQKLFHEHAPLPRLTYLLQPDNLPCDSL